MIVKVKCETSECGGVRHRVPTASSVTPSASRLATTYYTVSRRNALLWSSCALQLVMPPWNKATGDLKTDFKTLSMPPLPPEPLGVPRKSMNKAFAVDLLRAGYETTDAMDFFPMDGFQRAFWLTRRNEWEQYKLQYSPIIVEQVCLLGTQEL